MYFQITYKAGNGELLNDYLMEESDIKKARWFADHKVDGSYGETDLKLHSVKRISKAQAIKMFDSNCVAWCNEPHWD